VVPHEIPHYCALCPLNAAVSLSVYELAALQMFELGGPTPNWGGVEPGGGTKMVPF
jgi:hypothetical protein